MAHGARTYALSPAEENLLWSSIDMVLFEPSHVMMTMTMADTPLFHVGTSSTFLGETGFLF